jgi:hypothetical protein
MSANEQNISTVPGWAGLFGGAVAWYGAHDLSFYLVRANCSSHHWIAPSIHIAALAIAVTCGLISYRTLRTEQEWPTDVRGFAALVGTAAATLFSIAIVWQGIATLVYTGCER